MYVDVFKLDKKIVVFSSMVSEYSLTPKYGVETNQTFADNTSINTTT